MMLDCQHKNDVLTYAYLQIYTFRMLSYHLYLYITWEQAVFSIMGYIYKHKWYFKDVFEKTVEIVSQLSNEIFKRLKFLFKTKFKLTYKNISES